MAGWISSKLRVAETFLQQIDQQAADSLGKNEKPRSDDGALTYETPTKSEVIPLKDQLKKKPLERNSVNGNVQSSYDSGGRGRRKGLDNIAKPVLNPASAIAESDWTELLGEPTPITAVVQTNGVSALPKDQKRHGIGVSSLSPGEGKRSVFKSGRKFDAVSENKQNSDASDGDRKMSIEESGLSIGGSDSIQRKAAWESEATGNNILSEPKEYVSKDVEIVGSLENGQKSHSEVYHENIVDRAVDKVPVSATVNEIDDLKRKVDGDHGGIRNSAERGGYDVAARNSIPDELRRSSLSSDEQSDSETDSGSTSDSENENEKRIERRKRRERILAEEAAAKAVEAVKERENIVARLEGEKQSLEKILDEREKQQAQEASELQMNMMEMMDAVDLEKQKHKSTRMKALACLAKLETTNAELARSLATTQWNLEVQANRVADLRRQIELKEVAHEELRRRISNVHQCTSLSELEASTGVEFEREIHEAEFSFICDKIRQLQEKAKELEENIEMTRKEMEHPTEMEVEFKKRLANLTDHLIQKQAQVESLSSEKGTLLFRLEAVSRLLNESKSSLQWTDSIGPSSGSDIESGMWEEQSQPRLRPVFQDRIRSGRQHLGSIFRQLDAIFSAGAVFLKRNPAAQLWSLVYIVSLHFWVMYILISHSRASDDTSSGAIISLESINKTSGI